MAEQHSAPTGPDLGEGVRLEELAEGRPLLGHVHGKPAMLVRQGEEIFAVGAQCSHYGGPLAEGLVEGDTVRCPWHHACFSLRTGEALRAPALSDVPCYRVVKEDGRVRVAGKAPAPPRRQVAAPPGNVVIVGAGAAGNAAAEMLRREGYAGPITLFGADPVPPYDRPNLSKDYLAGQAPEDWIPLRPPDFYREHDIQVRTGTPVQSFDPRSKRLMLESGDSLPFDALLLATGAEPVRLHVPGAELRHVHVLRSLADCRAIIGLAERVRRVVVVGSSFIGMEVAASLVQRGKEVHVVSPDTEPFQRTLGPQVGAFLRSVHEEKGVRFHLGRKVEQVRTDKVLLDDGSEVPAELVVVGIGVRPALDLAESAGLKLERGVAVNEYLETSAPGVWAAGDIARWPDPHSGRSIRVEHWVVAERQGQTAARNILGRRERFAAVPFFWTVHYDVPLAYVGHAEQADRIEVTGSLEARDARVDYYEGGRRVAVATVGRDRECLEAEHEMERALHE